MYKKQMIFQKFVCYLVLAASAIVFIYSLGLVTDLYDSLYFMMPDPSDMSANYVSGAEIFYDIQDFNKLLTKLGIILTLLSLFMMIMNTHTRRRYYIGNYVAIALCTVANIAGTVWALKNIAMYKERYLTTVDFESLKMWSEVWKSRYTESTFWFDAGTWVFGLLLASTVLLAGNLIWKIIMMNKERRLIAEGKAADND